MLVISSGLHFLTDKVRKWQIFLSPNLLRFSVKKQESQERVVPTPHTQKRHCMLRQPRLLLGSGINLLHILLT